MPVTLSNLSISCFIRCKFSSCSSRCKFSSYAHSPILNSIFACILNGIFCLNLDCLQRPLNTLLILHKGGTLINIRKWANSASALKLPEQSYLLWAVIVTGKLFPANSPVPQGENRGKRETN